jgi:transposase-like protein
MGGVRGVHQARSVRVPDRYLYVAGIAERLRAGHPREAVIAAWGIGEDGRKVLLHLMAGSKETIGYLSPVEFEKQMNLA